MKNTLSKNFSLLASLTLMLSLAVACSNTSGSAGNTNQAPSDNKDNTARTSGISPQSVIGGCTMRVNSSKAPNVSGCVDFLHSGDSDLSVQDVQSACIQEGETFVSACPAVNIDAICKLSVQGKQIEMIIYNDTNSEDLSSFGSACANKGGQYNP